MSVPRAARRAAIAVLLAAMTAASPGLAAAARVEPGPGSRPVVPTIPGVPARLLVFVPAVVYVDHPFDVAVWIADDGEQLVREGTSAIVTLVVEAGPQAGPAAVLTCPGGLSIRSDLSGPNAGVALFADCIARQTGVFTIDATASDVRSTIVPAPGPAAHREVPLLVLPSIEAPQERIELTAASTGNPYAVATWNAPIALRITFTEHGTSQSFQLQERPRTTPTWRPVADLVTDQDGTATYTVRPGVSTWYRVVFSGSPELAAGRSRLFTALVQAVATQHPVHPVAKAIRRGATIRFETTVRPVLPDLAPMKVGFQLYHRVGGKWRLASLRTRPVDEFGVARINITFAGAGDWYVRSYAKGQLGTTSPLLEDAYLVALGQSEPTGIARFRVR